ncbi:hypothetical protein JL722_15065 [Aureococcus anophagefferens]|nr:hypothetical protein JL722_15065 [Aureococcus anophagefferens]
MGWSVAAFAWICLIARKCPGHRRDGGRSSIATRTRNSGYRALVQRIVDDGIAKHPKFRELKPYQHIVSLMSKAQGAHRRRRPARLFEPRRSTAASQAGTCWTAQAVDGSFLASDAFLAGAAEHGRIGAGRRCRSGATACRRRSGATRRRWTLRGPARSADAPRRRGVYADLRALFGAGSDFDANVAEVGVGYGAQSDVVQRLGGLLDGAPGDRRYTLCDLPEVEKLAGQYLAAVRRSEEPPATLNAAPDATATCGATNFTLFLSNYAFSELSADVQQIYWDQIVKCSARGYVTMNGYNGMTTRDPGPTKGEATSKQAKKARSAPRATRWCRESRSMPSRRQFRIWCDYDKNINAMQWRAADAARAVRH